MLNEHFCEQNRADSTRFERTKNVFPHTSQLRETGPDLTRHLSEQYFADFAAIAAASNSVLHTRHIIRTVALFKHSREQ